MLIVRIYIKGKRCQWVLGFFCPLKGVKKWATLPTDSLALGPCIYLQSSWWIRGKVEHGLRIAPGLM